MKTRTFLVIVAALLTACTMASASETSDNFAKWVAGFAASDMNERRDAQQNWQNWCRQQGYRPEVQQEIIRVSVEQLAKENPVETTVWIIRQLGMVGDASAVPALAKCLASGEIRVRDEAARALANIPGKEAADVLKGNSEIRTTQLAKDALTSRDLKAEVPNIEGIAAQPLLAIPSPFANPDEFNTWMEGYGKLSDMEKAQVLSNVAARSERMRVIRQQRGDAGRQPMGERPRRANPFTPLAIEAAKSSDETLRDAGILAVAALGSTAEVPFLLEQARVGGNTELVKLALSRMSGRDIDALLLETAKAETDTEKIAIIGDVLNRRFNTELRSELLTRAQAPNAANRLELLQIAESMSTKSEIPDFVKVWALITDAGQKMRAEQIIARLSGQSGQSSGDASVAMEALGDWDTPEGLSLLGRIGDPQSLDKIRQSKNALRAYVNWPNVGPNVSIADTLMESARNAELSDADRISALRAFIRVISLPSETQRRPMGGGGAGAGVISDPQKVARLAEAYELATRNEEKILIIQRVGQIRTLESLRFVMKYIDVPELRDEACQSVLDLAHQTFLRRQALEEFDAALDKVLAVTQRNDFRDRANRYKAQR